MCAFKKRKIKKVKFKPTVSKIEVVFGSWLKTIGIDHQTQFKILHKFYDFKVKNLPLIIEFHGDYYHANPKLYEGKKLNRMQVKNKANDEYKRALASISGFDIIYIWEDDFKKNKARVKRALLKKIEELKQKYIINSNTETL